MIQQSELVPTTPVNGPFVNPLIGPVGYVPGTIITYVLRGAAGDTGDHGGALWAQNGRRASFEAALFAWSSVTNISFVEASGAYSAAETSYDWVESFSHEAASLLGTHDLPFAGTLNGAFNLDSGIYSTPTTGVGSMAHSTFVHELGHALGLLHPHNEVGDPANDPVFPGVSDPFSLGWANQNQGVFTVMSYNGGYAEVGHSPSDEWGWEYGPMAFDIAAIQAIYGANMATNAGATTYALPQGNQAGTGWGCIWDGGGTDTISAAGTAIDAIIDLRAADLTSYPGAGGFVSRLEGVLGGFTIAAGAVIENAIGGSGDDHIHANDAANVIDGGAGLDTVDYSGTVQDLSINLSTGTVTGSGGDTLISIEGAIGGDGNDTLTASAGALTSVGAIEPIVSTGGTGMSDRYFITNFAAHTGDTTVATGAGLVTATLHNQVYGTNARYFELVVPVAGTQVILDIDNSFACDTSIELLNSLNHIIISNGDSGTLDAGSANIQDAYLTYTTIAADQHLFVRVISALVGRSNDHPSYDLNVTINGSVTGGSILLGSTLDGGYGNDTLIGSNGVDHLIGGSGNDTLDGRGNADILEGGGGADTYLIDSLGATIIESSYVDGPDIVISQISYTIPDGIERLNLAGMAVAGAGNSGDNVIIGNEIDNILYGNSGSDTIDGGIGNDEIHGDDGYDTLIGGDGADILFGEGEDDTLFGSRNGAIDELNGGSGDDIYYIFRQDDIIVEDLNSGNDIVYAEASFYLYNEIERLTLSGAGDLFGVGNASDNTIAGNDGANLLLGGDGADFLWGGNGNDALFGENGADLIYAGAGIDYIVGGAGNDDLRGQLGADAIYGGDGDDVLHANTYSSLDFDPKFVAPEQAGDFVTDILVGGNGNDALYGDSGLADYDLMDGGSGNDAYWVDTGDDKTFEALDGGIDTVHANVLVANAGVYLYANVENLVLEGTTAFGVGNELDNKLTGSASGNWLLGGAGNDTINGKAGNDVLFGESGADTFVFEAQSGADVIGDFQHGVDHIHLIGTLASFDQVQNSFHQVGSDGAIDLGGGNLIVLQGVLLSTLTAGDFLFG